MIRLIISDIDGTLVKEGSIEINPEYMEVIRQLADQGVAFAAASGRHSSSIDAVFHEVRNRIFYLSDNGSCIQKYGTPCHDLRLNTEDLKGYLQEALEGGDCQRELGVNREETVVFGDNFNDMSMLACGDRSYASVLSAPEVKQAARYEVASYEEDGVLQVLKDILQEVAHEK